MCQSKVAQNKPGVSFAVKDVVWLDVAMDDVKGVKGAKAEFQVMAKLHPRKVRVGFEWRTEFHEKFYAVIVANKIIVVSENDFRSHPKHRTNLIESILLDRFLYLLFLHHLTLFIKLIS